MGCRHPVTIHKYFLNTINKARVSAVTPNSAQYWHSSKPNIEAVRNNVLDFAPHPDPATCLNNEMPANSFFGQ